MNKWRNGVKQDVVDAFQCLKFHASRSALSALGVGIGTIALIAMLSIGEGAKAKALAQIQRLGIDVIRIQNQLSAMTNQQVNTVNLAKGLSLADVISIKTLLPKALVGAYIRNDAQSLVVNSQTSKVDVFRINKDWSFAESLDVAIGRSIQAHEYDNNAQVCVAGARLAKSLNLVIGDVMSLNSLKASCTLVGILAAKASFAGSEFNMADNSYDNMLLTPMSDAMNQLTQLSGLTVKLNISDDVDEINRQSGALLQRLQQNHNNVKDFKAVVPVELLNKTAEEKRIFSIVLGSIAGLSLIVGGIGIMNVMLAHLAEQTREIGLRVAMGATATRIMQLFLSYSLMLSLIGTVIGVVGGIVASMLVQHYANWPVQFSTLSLLIGPIFAMLTGLIFGLYPAYKAMKVNPNLAIRQV